MQGLDHQEDKVVQRTSVDTGQEGVVRVNPIVVDARRALDQAALAAAYWEAKVVVEEEDHHSCMEAAEAPDPIQAHPASEAAELRLASGQVAQAALAACKSCSTWWRRDRAGPAAAARLSSYGSDLAPAALLRRYWRKLRRAGRMRPGQTALPHGHSRGPAGPGTPSCGSSAGALFVCSGAESARHPALPKAHRPLCSLGFDSEPVSLPISRPARGWCPLP